MRHIRLGYNAVPASAKKLIDEVWKSGQFSPGPKVREFENQFAALHKAKHAIFVNSGTDALRLSLLALKEKFGWLDGDVVAVPAITFVATVNAIIQAGFKPFFVDVGMLDCTINPYNLERRIGTGIERLRAVIPVHMFGKACDPEIYKLAKRRNLKVIEDSCETILNPLKGDVSCHSTYMAHHVTTGVGGFALTNDNRLNLLIRSYANHGRNTAYLPGYKQVGLSIDLLKKRFRFDRMGYSCRATEFEAALGLAQLPDLQENVEKRKRVYNQLRDALSSPIKFPRIENTTAMMFPVARDNKYKFCLYLEKHGIETRDMMPITTQPCYKHLISKAEAEMFSVASWINEKGFYIPCNPTMTKNDVSYIAKTFESYLTK